MQMCGINISASSATIYQQLKCLLLFRHLLPACQVLFRETYPTITHPSADSTVTSVGLLSHGYRRRHCRGRPGSRRSHSWSFERTLWSRCRTTPDPPSHKAMSPTNDARYSKSSHWLAAETDGSTSSLSAGEHRCGRRRPNLLPQLCPPANCSS